MPAPAGTLGRREKSGLGVRGSSDRVGAGLRGFWVGLAEFVTSCNGLLPLVVDVSVAMLCSFARSFSFTGGGELHARRWLLTLS